MIADFVVIGGGVAGVSVAAMLSEDASVVLIEREAALGYHATGRSAALFTEAYGNAAIRALTHASRAAFDNPAAEFQSALLRPRGCLYLAGRGREERLEAFGQEIGARGLALTCLSVADVVDRVAQINPSSISGAVVEESAGDIDVDALLQGYRRIALAKGARFLCDAGAHGITRSGDHWRVALDRGETVMGKVLINAAGAWADNVALMAGVPSLGITPLRRTALLVDPPPGAQIANWPAVIDVDEQFYFKPDAGRLLVSPADETPTVPCDAQPEELDIAIAVERMQTVLEFPVRRVAKSWAGLRSFAPDRTPVVGFDPSASNFFWLAGQGGYGVQTAPALSRNAARLACGAALDDAVAARGVTAAMLSPARFRPEGV